MACTAPIDWFCLGAGDEHCQTCLPAFAFRGPGRDAWHGQIFQPSSSQEYFYATDSSRVHDCAHRVVVLVPTL